MGIPPTYSCHVLSSSLARDQLSAVLHEIVMCKGD